MGITKIPMNCTDEIIPFYEVNELYVPTVFDYHKIFITIYLIKIYFIYKLSN